MRIKSTLAAFLMGIALAVATPSDSITIYNPQAPAPSKALISPAPAKTPVITTPATPLTVPAKVVLKLPIIKPKPVSNFPWHKSIVTTTFWIGQGCSSYSDTTNFQSAWDESWTKNYGGMDDPTRRTGFTPRKFAATLNPFYVALPFNDVKYPDKAKKHCPWYKTPREGQRYVSQCKGRWVQIRNSDGKMCYCQWEDVGPLTTDHAEYVFGTDRPKVYSKAGLDVSPAAAQFLGINGKDNTDWRFVEAWEVPPGPWIKYGEQAIIFSALKKREFFKK